MTRRDQPSAGRVRAERRGRTAETLAAAFLRAKGYRILARRFRVPVGEVDLVAKRGRTLAFIEVKARHSEDAGIEAISPQGRARIARAADAYLSRYPAAAALTLRFDVIVISPWRWPRHLVGAFGAGGVA